MGWCPLEIPGYNFNQLRHESYLDRASLGQLAPTSSVIHSHIRHILCGIHNALNLLNRGYYADNPKDYGGRMIMAFNSK